MSEDGESVNNPLTWYDLEKHVADGSLEGLDRETLLAFSRIDIPPSSNPRFHKRFDRTMQRINTQLERLDKQMGDEETRRALREAITASQKPSPLQEEIQVKLPDDLWESIQRPEESKFHWGRIGALLAVLSIVAAFFIAVFLN